MFFLFFNSHYPNTFSLSSFLKSFSLFQTGKFWWLDGSSLDYHCWAGGEPNHIFTEEECVEMNWKCKDRIELIDWWLIDLIWKVQYTNNVFKLLSVTFKLLFSYFWANIAVIDVINTQHWFLFCQNLSFM